MTSSKISADIGVCHAYFAALSKNDLDGLAHLCHRNIIYGLRGTSPLSQEVHGLDAFLEMSRTVFAQFRSVRFDDVKVKAMAGPVGLYVATYSATWVSPTGDERTDDGRVVFQLQRERIARVAVLLSDEQLDDLTREWAPRGPVR